MLIDATRKRPMPPLALPAREPSWSTRARSGRSSACRRSPCTSPWHGYTLGDWTDTWETFARRATTGDWEESGRETLARQRTGVAPETSTKAGSAKMGE